MSIRRDVSLSMLVASTLLLFVLLNSLEIALHSRGIFDTGLHIYYFAIVALFFIGIVASYLYGRSLATRKVA